MPKLILIPKIDLLKLEQQWHLVNDWVNTQLEKCEC
jgi:hypothetical protein